MESASQSAPQLSVGASSETNDNPNDGAPDTLFSNPPHLANMRQRIFDPVAPLQISLSAFDTYFPYVDNVFSTARPVNSLQNEYTKVEDYPCRIHQSKDSLKGERNVKSGSTADAAKVPRAKRQKIEENCPMILRVTTTTAIGQEPQCTIKRADQNVGHIHDLDRSDELKRNSAIMGIARREGEEGYNPTSIYEQMCKEQDEMNDAGGKFMKPSDARNASIKWRQANPDVTLRTYGNATPGKRRRRSGRAQPKPQPEPQSLPPDTLRYPAVAQTFLQEYLPQPSQHPAGLPFITLTYATSLDARLSIMPGVQTVISGPESKAMTHYLRSKHDGILIGVGTAMADDPGLNCRIEGVGGYGLRGLSGQPRPVIIDPSGRLPIHPEMKVLKLARTGLGRPPWIIIAEGTPVSESSRRFLRESGGAFLECRWQEMPSATGQHHAFFSWFEIFSLLGREGLNSVMIEGGGTILSELLQPQYRDIISSVIITVAPTFLGSAGTMVAPNTFEPTGQDHTGRTNFVPMPNRLKDVKWQPMGNDDVIMCGRLGREVMQNLNGTDGNIAGILDGIEELAHQGGGHGPSYKTGKELHEFIIPKCILGQAAKLA